jgi:hypothetical protein
MQTNSQVGLLTYRRPTADTLVLEGNYEGDQLEIKLTSRDLQSIERIGRGYHWINEYPRNR